jgi:peptidoglycan/xylan/chitin deacetylase (PgdA/CDA1 family)
VTIVTTSWDDGHPLDLRLANLLDRYGVQGTFYVPREFSRGRMDDSALCELAQYEIGAHTLNHVPLTDVQPQTAYEEIRGSRAWLQDLLSRDVPMFCYPKGRHNADVREMVRQAGFSGARTVEMFVVTPPDDAYQMGTTILVYPHPLRFVPGKPLGLSRALWDPIGRHGPGIRRLELGTRAWLSWSALAKATFDATMARGGIWHLCGHSWEIEKYGMWRQLEDVLRYVSARPGVRYLTNGQVICGSQDLEFQM